MPYKISGTLSDAARVIIIKESDWSIESNTNELAGAYEVDSLVTGAKWVTARKSDGEIVSYGSVMPIEYVTPPGNRGVFMCGTTAGDGEQVNVMDYITITSTGNATDFGDNQAAIYDVSGCDNGTSGRGLIMGGRPWTSEINYITIGSPGNSVDFGNFGGGRSQGAGTSNGANDRGINFDGYVQPDVIHNAIEYVTISSLGNTQDFGDLITAKKTLNEGATSNGVNNRGICSGGYPNGGGVNTIEYITISSTGNASDFGDLNQPCGWATSVSNTANDRGVIFRTTGLDYVTISSTGNATTFGNLTDNRSAGSGGASNGTNNRGVWAGGKNTPVNIIDYVTITSTGDATDFGDLTLARKALAGVQNS